MVIMINVKDDDDYNCSSNYNNDDDYDESDNENEDGDDDHDDNKDLSNTFDLLLGHLIRNSHWS